MTPKPSGDNCTLETNKELISENTTDRRLTSKDEEFSSQSTSNKI